MGLEKSHTSPVCLMPWGSSDKGISCDVAIIKQNSSPLQFLGIWCFWRKQAAPRIYRNAISQKWIPVWGMCLSPNQQQRKQVWFLGINTYLQVSFATHLISTGIQGCPCLGHSEEELEGWLPRFMMCYVIVTQLIHAPYWGWGDGFTLTSPSRPNTY